MKLDQNSSIPLYEQLKNDIKRDIKEGVFPAGSRMPSEDELGEKYSVSRITVRRAVKELCDEDYLIKKQGKGTFVLDNASIPVTVSQGFHDVWEKKGKKVTVDIVENKVIKLEGEYRDLLNLRVDDEVFFIKRVLKADEKPMMIDIAYIPLKLYPNFQKLMETEDSIYRLLKKRYGFHPYYYYKVMKIKKADKEFSKLLACEPGTHLFDLFKISYDAERCPIYLSVSYSRGEDVSYVITGSEDDDGAYSGFKWRG